MTIREVIPGRTVSYMRTPYNHPGRRRRPAERVLGAETYYTRTYDSYVDSTTLSGHRNGLRSIKLL